MATKLAHFENELTRHVVILAWRFVQRWDLYARQLDDGNYMCVHQPLTIKHLISHLKGEITLGTYMLDMESKTRLVAVDADDEQGFDRLLLLDKTLADNDIPSYLEKSRRDSHLWFFLTKAVSGRQAREFGLGILAVHQIKDVELFPKQNELTEGPGSLLRLPFGVHRLTRQRYGFYDHTGLPLAPTIRKQIEAFSEPQTVPEALFFTYRSNMPLKPSRTVSESSGEYTDLAAQIKNKVRVIEFVSRYVDLKPIGSGAVGLCPFHEDHHPSLGVNDRENYWNCFAGCGGGSIIDFWMKWQGCDFATALKELAQMLL